MGAVAMASLWPSCHCTAARREPKPLEADRSSCSDAHAPTTTTIVTGGTEPSRRRHRPQLRRRCSRRCQARLDPAGQQRHIEAGLQRNKCKSRSYATGFFVTADGLTKDKQMAIGLKSNLQAESLTYRHSRAHNVYQEWLEFSELHCSTNGVVKCEQRPKCRIKSESCSTPHMSELKRISSKQTLRTQLSQSVATTPNYQQVKPRVDFRIVLLGSVGRSNTSGVGLADDFAVGVADGSVRACDGSDTATLSKSWRCCCYSSTCCWSSTVGDVDTTGWVE